MAELRAQEQRIGQGHDGGAQHQRGERRDPARAAHAAGCDAQRQEPAGRERDPDPFGPGPVGRAGQGTSESGRAGPRVAQGGPERCRRPDEERQVEAFALHVGRVVDRHGMHGQQRRGHPRLGRAEGAAYQQVERGYGRGSARHADGDRGPGLAEPRGRDRDEGGVERGERVLQHLAPGPGPHGAGQREEERAVVEHDGLPVPGHDPHRRGERGERGDDDALTTREPPLEVERGDGGGSRDGGRGGVGHGHGRVGEPVGDGRRRERPSETEGAASAGRRRRHPRAPAGAGGSRERRPGRYASAPGPATEGDP